MTPSIIRDAVILPVEPATVIDRGWIRIADGRIEAVGAGEPEVATEDVVLDVGGGLVIPGLVNTHLHSLDVLLRGIAPAGPGFLDWLLGHYYGGVVHYTPEDCGVASLLAGTSALRAGTTCVVDNWGVAAGAGGGYVLDCARASLSAYRRLGLRVTFARMFATRLPDSWSGHPFRFDPALLVGDLDDCLIEVRTLAEEWSSGRLLQVAPAPELVEMVGVDGALAAAALAADLDVVLPMHLLTTVGIGARALDDAGVLSSRVLGAHCIGAGPDDLLILAERDVAVAHCPTANLAGGAAVPVRRFLDAGLRVGLGTDNPSLAHHLDVLREARQAALLGRLLEPDRLALTGQEALRLATLGGAQAVGLGDCIGSIEPGKQADLAVIDVSADDWSPHDDWAETLVRRGHAGDVRHVLVDGRLAVADGRVVALPDDAELPARVRQATAAVLDRSGLRTR